MRFVLELSYKGTNFCGWQRQDNAMSVQQHLEDCFYTFQHHKIEITGCGRTDKGVHAKHYIAHFDYDKCLDGKHLYQWNALLNNDVVISQLRQVDSHFHARFDATARTYKYFIHTKASPFLNEGSFLLHNNQLDVNLMNQVAQQLIGTHDFTSFEKKGSNNKTSICTIKHALWTQQDEQLIFTIVADRFLRNMVRAITASLLMIGTRKMTEQTFLDNFITQKQMPLKLVVPAKGLFLWQIDYDNI
ncbi:MAG: tRNA pseudouridine(38-40) synthase TruA [Chitinophagales bacterium]